MIQVEPDRMLFLYHKSVLGTREAMVGEMKLVTAFTKLTMWTNGSQLGTIWPPGDI